MPLFEFICKKCSEKFEVVVFDNETISCPKCKGLEIIRQFASRISVISPSSSCNVNCEKKVNNPRCSYSCRNCV